jgi:hypothetical protein
LQHVKIFVRVALGQLAIKIEVIIGRSSADLDWLFQVCDELPEE